MSMKNDLRRIYRVSRHVHRLRSATIEDNNVESSLRSDEIVWHDRDASSKFERERAECSPNSKYLGTVSEVRATMQIMSRDNAAAVDRCAG